MLACIGRWKGDDTTGPEVEFEVEIEGVIGFGLARLIGVVADIAGRTVTVVNVDFEVGTDSASGIGTLTVHVRAGELPAPLTLRTVAA